LEAWEAAPELKFAELIDGVVYMPSPVSAEHSDYDYMIGGWAYHYQNRCPMVQGGVNGTWLMLESAPQPDFALRLLPEFGGRVRTERGLFAGVPEFIVEVTRSSRTYDLGPKLGLYQRAGVSEYLAVLIQEQRLEWRILRDGRYELLRPDQNGVYKSQTFPGLWLSEPAFWKRDIPAVLLVLEKGLQTPEFTAFCAKYQTR
jgi:Uma2 family endonuclease